MMIIGVKNGSLEDEVSTRVQSEANYFRCLKMTVVVLMMRWALEAYLPINISLAIRIQLRIDSSAVKSMMETPKAVLTSGLQANLTSCIVFTKACKARTTLRFEGISEVSSLNPVT